MGLAVINTVLNKRLDLHLARLHENVAWGRAQAEDTLNGLTAQMGTMLADPDMAALKRLSLIVRKQANVLSFADVFLVLSILFVTLALFALLMNKPAAAAPAGAGH